MNISLDQPVGAPRRVVISQLLAAGRFRFLAGGLIVYAVGATTARYAAGALSSVPLLLGLLVVLFGQLTTNYLNEYFDRDTDAVARARTVFSGGSGIVLNDAGLIRRTGVACCAVGAGITLLLGLGGYLSPVSLVAITVGIAGGIVYSTPPLRLVARGLGEVDAALVAAFLAPLVGFGLQTGGLSRLIVAVCLPLMIGMFAMVLAFALPDYDADRSTGKATLPVKMGLKAAARLYAVALAAVYVASLAGMKLGAPAPVAILPLIMIPVAVLQVKLAGDVAKGDNRRVSLMTFLAAALFFCLAALQLVGFVLAA